MNAEVITGLVVAGNILATNLISIGTKVLTNNYVENKTARTVINTVVPIVSAVGIGAGTSGIIADAWNELEVMDEEVDTDVETVDQAAMT